jgi:glutathione S-transferase
MFQNPVARTALRAVLAAVLAGLGAASAALIDGSVSAGEAITIATATVSAFAAWFGVGAAMPPVEPHIGNRGDYQ